MKYKEIGLELQEPLSFWKAFEGQERVYWKDQQHNRLIIAAGRLKKVSQEESHQYPYCWYSRTFFSPEEGQPIQKVKSAWQTMGNELVAFAHYYICDEKGARYLHAETVPAKSVSDQEVVLKKIAYTWTEEDKEDWDYLFEGIHKNIENGSIKKAVASRQICLHLQETVDSASIIKRLNQQNQECFIFAYEKDKQVFLGASPEILVQKQGSTVLSYALAGTIRKEVGKEEVCRQQLLHDTKNIHEHSLVVNMIKQIMSRMGRTVMVGPMHLMELRNLFHLRSLLTVEDERHSIFDWIQCLHPTPAMGGLPQKKAMDVIRQYERHDRGLYASPLGFIDAKGDGLIVVGIRSALLTNKAMYAYAGCGIVDGSICQEEYEETRTKFKTILDALQ